MDVENLYINIIFIIIIIRTLRICWWRKNIILILLSLEILIISLFISIILSISTISTSSLLIILAIIVRGSRLGLRLLVSISHLHKSSNSIYINTLTYDKTTHSFNFYNYNNIYIIESFTNLYNYPMHPHPNYNYAI